MVKHEKYGSAFLAVIRDGCETNEAFSLYENDRSHAERTRPEALGQTWSETEEKKLREEFESELSLQEIAKRHQRTTGSIRTRLRRLGCIE